MVRWFSLRILAVAFILNAVYAQDRSRSRYVPSTADEALDSEEEKPQRVPFTRRAPSRRTRPTTVPDEENSQLADNIRVSRPRLPTNVEPHLVNSYDTRQSLRDQTSYHAPNSDVQNGSEDPPSNVPQRRRKRPKKRRRPKTDQNNIPEIHNLQAQPSSESPPSPPNIEDNSDYLAYRTPGLIPTTEATQLQRGHQRDDTPLLNVRGQAAAEVPSHTARVSSRDSVQRYDHKAIEQNPLHGTSRRGSNRDVTHRGDSRDSTRYIGDVRNANSDSSLRNTERSYRRQSYQPQSSSNRLPVDNVDEHSRFNDQAKDYAVKLPEHLNAEPPSPPQSGYPSRQPPSDYAGGYIPVANPDATRLPLQGHPSEDRLPPGVHETIDPAIRLLPTEQPLNVPIYSHNNAAEQPEVNIPLTTAGIENVKDQEPNTRYPVASNRLPEPGGVSYQSQGDVPSFSHAEKNLNGDVKLGHLGTEDDRRALTSDRLPPESHRRSLPIDEDISLARLPRPEPRQQHTPAAVTTRTGSRYLPEHERAPSHVRSSNEQIPARQQHNQLRANTDPRYQRGSSRYHSNIEAPIREHDEGETTTVRQHTDVRSQRSRSRYQPDDSESVRHVPTRSQPQEQHVRGTSAPQRSIPRSQRARTQYQPDPLPDVTDGEPQRRIPQRHPDVSRNVPTPGVRAQRTRADYQQANAVQPNSYNISPEYQQDQVSRQIESSQPRQIPNQGRTRSRHQPQYPSHLSEGISDEEEQEIPRSNPHYDNNPRPNDRTRNSQPEHIPEYQNVQRVTQRRPEPRPTVPHHENADERPPQRVAYRQPEPETPRSRHTNAATSRAPRRGTNEAPPPPSASSSGRTAFRCPNPYGFYPDENQCDKYYECQNGTAEEGLCSDGLAFNLISAPTYLRCDSIRDIDCSSRPELQKPQPTKNCPRRFGLYGDEKDCTKFWHCVDGAATQVQCPPGLVYDDTKGTCNWADLVEDSCRTEDLIGFNCPEASTAELQAGVYTRYPHPDNCQLHFTCIKGADGHRRPRLLSCNEGFVFDPETTQCTRPENVPGCEEFYGKPTRAPPRKPAREPPPPAAEEEEEEVPRTRSQRRRRPSNQRSRS